MNQQKRESATPYMDLIRIISMKMKVAADKQVSELGLNAQQGRVIAYIHAHQEKGIMQKDLAEVFHRRGASITSMLQGLEKKGYIERIIPKDNERIKRLYVLPKGKALIDQFHGNFERLEADLIVELNESEQQEFKRLLAKVNDSLPNIE